jgi:hypothetical protein
MSRFALYKDNIYPLNVRDDNLRLRSNFKEERFKELIAISVNKHNDIFIK